MQGSVADDPHLDSEARGSPKYSDCSSAGSAAGLPDLRRLAALVLEPLTPEEEARHARGIEKIRKKLFSRHSPEDYFIAPGSERILRASAESCWNAACGDYRVFRFGGLSYEFDCGGSVARYTFSLCHFNTDTFIFWLSAPQGHTLSCISIAFKQLDELPYAYVVSCRRANQSPLYVGMTDK